MMMIQEDDRSHSENKLVDDDSRSEKEQMVPMSGSISGIPGVACQRGSDPGPLSDQKEAVALDGRTLTPEKLMQIGYGQCQVQLPHEAVEGILSARSVVERLIDEDQVSYGVTTGVGIFATTRIPLADTRQLQKNIVTSHASGVGPPLSLARTRMLLALKTNTLARGHSGVTVDIVRQCVAAINANCLPWVPEKGTVGASGDLAPLAHLTLGLMGEGKMWSPDTGWDVAKHVLEANKLSPITLEAKEGLSLINGTQLMTALGAEAVVRAARLCRQADVIAALTLEALRGSCKPYDVRIHLARPHPGQTLVATRLRALLHSPHCPSEISENHAACGKVQDPYSLRCIPQVHGVVNDTVEFVRQIVCTEINSVTDNPLVFPESGDIISGGNFHGEYVAKSLDYLAIGVHELASISERRTNRLLTNEYSGLPDFLTPKGGLNSGLITAHITAAALVSENKGLCHPSSVDSIPTTSGQEDHVSMGGYSARKCLTVLDHVEQVLAIELICACQALEFLRPLKTTQPLEAVYQLVRTVIRQWEGDRFLAPDIEAATELLKDNKVWDVAAASIDQYQAPQGGE